MESRDGNELPIFSTEIPDTPQEYLDIVQNRMKFEHQWKYLQYTANLTRIRQFLVSKSCVAERINWIKENASFIDQSIRFSCHPSVRQTDLQYAKGMIIV